MNPRSVMALLMFVCLAAVPARAQELDPDTEGCKDSKLLTRMPGCRIDSCEVKEFDARDLIVAYDGDNRVKNLEGAVEVLDYHCPTKYSFLQLSRNAEAALKKAGYTIVFSGKNNEADDRPVVTAQKGAQWVSVETHEYNVFPTYKVIGVLVKNLEQTMTAGAQAIADAINTSGRLDVYGITFATGQATITPQSNQVLTDLLAVLQANPEWQLRVEGHTDNVGTPAANLKLSDARARAVVAWLTGRGVAAGRLTAAGLGDTQPIGDNKTDDGRAQNRRVVLVKQ